MAPSVGASASATAPPRRWVCLCSPPTTVGCDYVKPAAADGGGGKLHLPSPECSSGVGVGWVRRVHWAVPLPSAECAQRPAAQPKARRCKPPREMAAAPGRPPPPRPPCKRSPPFEPVRTGVSTQPKRYAVDRGGPATDIKVPAAAGGREGSPMRGQAVREAPHGQRAAADASPPSASPLPSGSSPLMADCKGDAAPHRAGAPAADAPWRTTPLHEAAAAGHAPVVGVFL